jgi:hypothetical protein
MLMEVRAGLDMRAAVEAAMEVVEVVTKEVVEVVTRAVAAVTRAVVAVTRAVVAVTRAVAAATKVAAEEVDTRVAEEAVMRMVAGTRAEAAPAMVETTTTEAAVHTSAPVEDTGVAAVVAVDMEDTMIVGAMVVAMSDFGQHFHCARITWHSYPGFGLLCFLNCGTNWVLVHEPTNSQQVIPIVGL